MGTATGVSAIVAVYAVLVGFLVWVGRHARRRGTGGNVLGAFDEIWHPAGYRHRIEVERHDARVESPPSPGDRPHLRVTGLG